jgi:hypothetical protein
MRSYRSVVIRTALAAALLSACADDVPTGVPADGQDLLANLDLTIPTALRGHSVVRTISEKELIEGAPARTEHLGYGTYPGTGNEWINAVAAIWNARTRAYFLPGQFSAVGSHDYGGNKGAIETQATVKYQGTVIGTERAYREDSYPFLLAPFFGALSIWAEARIYTDRECDLTGFGGSQHHAWWEAVMGGPVFDFSRVGMSSMSELESQPACAVSPPTTNTGGSGGSGNGGGEGVCYVWVTYDLDTGQIYHQELLYCTDGG